jgi:hypothetical protein
MEYVRGEETNLSEANPQRGGPDRSLFVARASPRQPNG